MDEKRLIFIVFNTFFCICSRKELNSQQFYDIRGNHKAEAFTLFPKAFRRVTEPSPKPDSGYSSSIAA